MVRVEMLAVGRELLIGRTLNTNAHWLGARLAKMGSMLKSISTVDDDLTEISSAVRDSIARRADFVIVVGGLGPTPDDMTLKGIALGLERRIKSSPEALAMVRRHYEEAMGKAFVLTPPRKKMAFLPDRGTPLLNENGTAPGVRIVEGRTILFSLPGVPLEMKRMFVRSVEPEIRLRTGALTRVVATLGIVGVPESAIALLIDSELRRHPGAYIKSHPKGSKEGVSRIEMDVAVVAEDPSAASSEVSAITGAIGEWAAKNGGVVSEMKAPRKAEDD